jgi:hypothetical protein
MKARAANARYALVGGWRGPKASALIERMTAAAGVRKAA